MKYTRTIATAAALVWLTGCASSPPVMVLTPVCPAPLGQEMTSGQSSLRVYSARYREPVAENFMEWQWDADFTAVPYFYELAHSDYVIRTETRVQALYGELIANGQPVARAALHLHGNALAPPYLRGCS
jgi:hypothetical protein